MRFPSLWRGALCLATALMACVLAPAVLAAPAVATCERPTRVVSLSPTATEMLYAVGAGSQVIAVDDQSNFPKRAPDTKLSGFRPNAEAIIAFRPDLVIVSGDANRVVSSLRTAKVRVLVAPAAATLADTYRQIRQIGAATCRKAGAKRLVARMKRSIARIVASVPAATRDLTYYHELDQFLFTATSKTFIGQVYRLLGLRNIADEADGAGSGFPQLSAEYVIASSPDLIFLADTKCCRQNAATVAARPGWESIAAVKNGAVFALNDDVASRWGPRVVTFLRIVARRIAPVT